MINKKILTQSILKNISKNMNEVDENIKLNVKSLKQDIDLDIEKVEINTNSFIMVPINHPKINEIIKILNNIEKEKKITDKLDKEEKKVVITLNDILSSDKDKLILPINAIITPMALDYIKQKKIEVCFFKNQDK